jgi:tetratricopeptide (TPR) repeat protein
MKDLPQVTLCAIDCVNPVLALRALDISLQQCRFGDAVFLSDSADRYQLPGCRMVSIPRIDSRADYSRFVIKELGEHFRTSHVLVVQWDGYVLNGNAWREEFLDYDYIGAPWRFHTDGHRIGNGGFSLRSRRLLDALSDPAVTELDPEDEAIGRRYRPLLEQCHGVRFPPESLARNFSFESLEPLGPPFGFHGLFNMWMLLPPGQLAEFVETLAPSSVAGIPMLRLAANYVELKRWQEAAVVLRRRLQVVPGDAEAQALLARIPDGAASGAPSVGEQDLLQAALGHHQQGRLAEAEAAYRKVLGLNPGNAVAKQYLGVLAMQQGDPGRGEAMIREAIAAMPGMPDFHNNLGLCLRQQDRLREAVLAYRQALALNPGYLPARNNLGLDLMAQAQLPEAAAEFEQAIAAEPKFAEAHWNLGLALLTLGELPRGWREYEWRLQCQPFGDDGLNLAGVAPWRGEPLVGKTLLVRREQGAGDTAQFLRFLPRLCDQGARVLLHVRPEMAVLARSVDPRVELVDPVALPAAPDYYANLLSLPRWLEVTLDALPGPMPYLHAESGRLEAWRERLAAYPGRRIGLVWGGNPKHKNDRNRSCPLAVFKPLLDLPGISWFSLQKGEPARQLAEIEPGKIIDLGPEFQDFADTAAALEALDLLITVDTSVAHVAGALGRPAWVMIPKAPDWRWLLDREDSPWYPSLRLFRQEGVSGWHGVRDRIAEALMAGAGVDA